MNHDDWKTQSPPDGEDEHFCVMCDRPVREGETYCSSTCLKADMDDE